MDKNARIYVAGGSHLIGAGLLRSLARSGYRAVVTEPEPDFTDAAEVEAFFAQTRPQFVCAAAGLSAGIGANQRRPADLMHDNLLAQTHLLHSAHRHGVERLMLFSASCIYPKECSQPMCEEALFTGSLEPTSAPYAVAKLAGLLLCRAYRTQHGSDFFAVIPANVYGPGDSFDPEEAHVVGALMRRIHDAHQSQTPAIEIWGTGAAQREFLFVDDLADAALHAMQHYRGEGPLNLGGGSVVSIREVAQTIRDVIGYRGELCFDPSKPDGFALKALDSSRLHALDWHGHTPLREGLERTYRWAVVRGQL